MSQTVGSFEQFTSHVLHSFIDWTVDSGPLRPRPSKKMSSSIYSGGAAPGVHARRNYWKLGPAGGTETAKSFFEWAVLSTPRAARRRPRCAARTFIRPRQARS